ncbi:MAG TPA: imidazole glycerol phosphate synthase subunit HisH [Puia sp.]|nr:imidazole glycerol phosphate synthase subunit HisH [Puia sp.]
MFAIVNYGLGNLSSIRNMCRRIGVTAEITSDPGLIAAADKLILPGVGHFRKGMENLHASGLKTLLDRLVLEEGRPILGICLGAQLMTRHSEEGDTTGLGWVDADTIRFREEGLAGLKVPHMGWGEIAVSAGNPLWAGLPAEPRFYFVHSYHFRFQQAAEVAATARYGYEFACAFRKGNIFGTQFHPEKSHKYGMRVLENFYNFS